jgi:dimethylamine/trimethylamine dehydrogenase
MADEKRPSWRINEETAMRDARYDILFEPVRIGPVTARNRFYQAPHCSGMGHRYPQSDAAMRGVKAEGGWAVICTQETEIHPTSDISPSNQARNWDDRDIARLALMADAVHQHGSLAALELAHNGLHASNRYSRLAPLAPSHAVVDNDDPVQARAMDRSDIRALRRWYRDSALRGRAAGYDIIYVYAGHDMSMLQHFLSRRHNHRTDEYGGSFENRLRLFRETIADVRDAIGDRCALAVRLAVDELLGDEGIGFESEGRDIVAALAEEPDLWDVNISDWANDSQTSRFSEEGYQEPYISFVKSLTSKPVVGVGRYTSPDSMVRVVRKGVMDLIGAARPSIADPFLPKKIEEGRIDDIRECIGCNICVSGDNLCVPMRCTQNPTVGEEWRNGWHPEVIPAATKKEPVLVVGGGPAGLEAARALSQRGVSVILAEAGEEWGGRVSRESRLPGLAAWTRVRDWRLGQLQRSPDVEMYLSSRLTAENVLEYGIANVALATGAKWRCDGVGRTHRRPLSFVATGALVSPDDLLERGAAAISADGPVVIFDDDRYYMASVLAELTARAGLETIYVTPAPIVAPWTVNTLEQRRIQLRLLELNVTIMPLRELAGRTADALTLACVYTGKQSHIACGSLVPVTGRTPDDGLWQSLQNLVPAWSDAGLLRVERLGDCLAPGIIASAVYSGHQFARTYGCGSEKLFDRRED